MSHAAARRLRLPRRPLRLAGIPDTCASCPSAGVRLVPERFRLPARSDGRTLMLAPVLRQRAGRSLRPYRAVAPPLPARQLLVNPLKPIWANLIRAGIRPFFGDLAYLPFTIDFFIGLSRFAPVVGFFLISFAKVIELSYYFPPSNDVSHRFSSRTLIGQQSLTRSHIESRLIYQSQVLGKHELQSRVLASEVNSHAMLVMSKYEHEKSGILLIQRQKQSSKIVTTDLSGVAQPDASAAWMRRYRDPSSQPAPPAVEFRMNSSDGPYVIA